MAAVFEFISSNTWQANAFVIGFFLLTILVSAIFVAAFLQNREFALWPPKISPRATLTTLNTETRPIVDPGAIRITTPKEDVTVAQSFEVEGSIERLPDKHELWLFTTDHAGGHVRYWPQERAFIHKDNTWSAKVWGLGGGPNKTRRFGVFLVGPDGQALVSYYKDTMQTLVAPNRDKLKYQPLSRLTADITPCHEIAVTVGE